MREQRVQQQQQQQQQQLLLLQQQDQQRRQQDEVHRRQQQAATGERLWRGPPRRSLASARSWTSWARLRAWTTIAARLGTGRTPKAGCAGALAAQQQQQQRPAAARMPPHAQSETIRIPAGAKPGQELRVSLASGKVVFVRVPPNVAPGHLLKVVNGPPPASAAPLPVATPADMAALSAGAIAGLAAAARRPAAAAKPIELPTPVPPCAAGAPLLRRGRRRRRRPRRRRSSGILRGCSGRPRWTIRITGRPNPDVST